MIFRGFPVSRVLPTARNSPALPRNPQGGRSTLAHKKSVTGQRRPVRIPGGMHMTGPLRPMEPGLPDVGDSPVLMVLAAKYRDLDMDCAARLQAAAARVARHLVSRNGPVVGCVVLPTCNRFEIYCEVRTASLLAAACRDALDSISHCTDLPLRDVRSSFDPIYGPAVTEHLLAVGAGLESLVVGEREISGQVRRALAAAQAHGTATGRLVRLFQAAARTAKDLSARVSLGGAGSAASVALDLAAAALRPGTFAGKSAVVLGSGIYAGTVVRILRSRGCPDIAVFSRSGRAEAFAADKGVRAIPALELEAFLARADLLVGCSGTGTRLGLSDLAASRRRSGSTLVAVDLAPNHDLDPRIADLPGVDFITLESVRRAAPPADLFEVQRARALVRQAADRFEEREAIRAVDSAIVALRRHVEQILDSEMERVRSEQGCTGSAAETSAALRRVVRRLLHEPAVRARELAAAGRTEEYLAALDALFGISVEPSSPPVDLPQPSSRARSAGAAWPSGLEGCASA